MADSQSWRTTCSSSSVKATTEAPRRRHALVPLALPRPLVPLHRYPKEHAVPSSANAELQFLVTVALVDDGQLGGGLEVSSAPSEPRSPRCRPGCRYRSLRELPTGSSFFSDVSAWPGHNTFMAAGRSWSEAGVAGVRRALRRLHPSGDAAERRPRGRRTCRSSDERATATTTPSSYASDPNCRAATCPQVLAITRRDADPIAAQQPSGLVEIQKVMIDNSNLHGLMTSIPSMQQQPHIE